MSRHTTNASGCEATDVSQYRQVLGEAGMKTCCEWRIRMPTNLEEEPAEQLVEVYEKLIEPTLIDPTVTSPTCPAWSIPLARENRDDPFSRTFTNWRSTARRSSPGYTELNDPDVQDEHFRHQVGDREEQQKVDEDFLNALTIGHASGRRHGPGHRPPGDDAHRGGEHSRCDSVPAACGRKPKGVLNLRVLPQRSQSSQRKSGKIF